MPRKFSLQFRAEIARDQARRAREVAAGIASGTVRARLEDCALAWDRDAEIFETVTARSGEIIYWNDVQRDIL
jgi:hypothetical protein